MIDKIKQRRTSVASRLKVNYRRSYSEDRAAKRRENERHLTNLDVLEKTLKDQPIKPD